MNAKRCFVIAPIGEEGSDTRVRSDQILSYVIRTVATKFGFDVTRADEITEPGIISTQILERVINDPLVIADLTERNPNVYYELAVRHATRKPVIQLIQKGEPLPFDVAGTRTVIFDHRDLDSVENAKKQLARFIESIESASIDGFDSPISLALNLQTLRESSDPQKAGLADIVERITGMYGAVLSIQSFIDRSLSERLDQLLRIVVNLEHPVPKNSTADAVSELSVSIERLRTRLIEAVSNIFDEIQEQHSELAKKIQSVFEEQSETASLVVQRSFANEIALAMPDHAKRDRLLENLLQVFMHGMKSMGTYQQINIKEHTEASANAIRERINKSIEEVFHSIDRIEHQVVALPRGPAIDQLLNKLKRPLPEGKPSEELK